METSTPLLEQWHKIKKQYPDAIILFRLGDFYETFYQDAVLASKILGITLTQRQSGVPLAGIPHHAATPYIAKLVKANYKVAICEQLEPPQPGKLVKRDVIEVITQGTLVEDALLEATKNNYLASIFQNDINYGLALIDLSTGEFKVTELNKEELIDELKRLSPGEIITSVDFDFIHTSKIDTYKFNYDIAKQELIEHFNVASLDGFGCKDLHLAVSAAGAALSYLKSVKKSSLPHINPPKPYFLSKYLLLDEPTRKNLELIQKINNTEGEGTLLWVLNHTYTPMGIRLLRNFILFPLVDIKEINNRLDKVEYFVKNLSFLGQFTGIISSNACVSDLERLATRVSMERATPRDITAISNTLKILPGINTILPKEFESYKMPDLKDIAQYIEKAIVASPPPTIEDGGVIKQGFSKELDEIRELSYSGKKWVSDFESRERIRTKIQSLKVGFNNTFGYYIEITRSNLKLVPQDYIRKQTTVNSERFITEELKQYEYKILSAEERIKRMEYEIFSEVRKKVASEVHKIQDTARKLAELDVFASFAFIATQNNYVKPEITEENSIIIKDGRHPVVDKLISKDEFIPNPTTLDDEQQIYIITGPNMAGKSTYLRQVGLITLMAQLGSFVPASYARIGVRDRIFTRIGASDDLSRGVSTFLAEMNETANILNNATNRSLVLLDEIGRGTSTYDGMSIAWAVAEYLLQKIGTKTLFATHYHELSELATIFSEIKNYHIAVKRYEDKIIFLRQLKPGQCDDSYGIEVAKLGGVPGKVIKRAQEVLESLEIKELKSSKIRSKSKQTDFFTTPNKQELNKPESKILETIANIDPDKITPVDALLLIKKLKEMS
ncbi:MAG: DNA mismatch repair protein MutS [bacterium]